MSEYGKEDLGPTPEGFRFGEGFLARATIPSEGEGTYIKVKPLSLNDTIQLLKQNIRREAAFRRGEVLPSESRE